MGVKGSFKNASLILIAFSLSILTQMLRANTDQSMDMRVVNRVPQTNFINITLGDRYLLVQKVTEASMFVKITRNAYLTCVSRTITCAFELGLDGQDYKWSSRGDAELRPTRTSRKFKVLITLSENPTDDPVQLITVSNKVNFQTNIPLNQEALLKNRSLTFDYYSIAKIDQPSKFSYYIKGASNGFVGIGDDYDSVIPAERGVIAGIRSEPFSGDVYIAARTNHSDPTIRIQTEPITLHASNDENVVVTSYATNDFYVHQSANQRVWINNLMHTVDITCNGKNSTKQWKEHIKQIEFPYSHLDNRWECNIKLSNKEGENPNRVFVEKLQLLRFKMDKINSNGHIAHAEKIGNDTLAHYFIKVDESQETLFLKISPSERIDDIFANVKVEAEDGTAIPYKYVSDGSYYTGALQGKNSVYYVTIKWTDRSSLSYSFTTSSSEFYKIPSEAIVGIVAVCVLIVILFIVLLYFAGSWLYSYVRNVRKMRDYQDQVDIDA